MEKQLRVRRSDFTTPLTFNEWCEKYGISTKWDNTVPANRDMVEKIELAKFIQENPNIYSVPEPQKKPTMLEEIKEFVSHDIRGYFITLLS